MQHPNAGDVLVSVGLPVFNEEARLEQVVGDLLAQTHRTLEIVISDNASTDRTAAIADGLAAADPRVRVLHQETNIGAAANFRRVIEESRGEFFMWAAADDRWDPFYIERNLDRLTSDPGVVGSVSKMRWIIGGEDAGLVAGTFPLNGSVRHNVKEYLWHARDNSRFYGLYRRGVLLASYPDENFYASDLAIMLGTLLYGRHVELAEVLMTRSRTDPGTYILQVDAADSAGIDRWLPMLPFTRYVLRELRIPLSPTAVLFLVIRNVYEHFRYAATRGSLYGRLAQVVMRVLGPARGRVVARVD